MWNSDLLCYTFIHSDIDECTEETDNCDDNAICTNTDGSFTCECESGFSGNGVQCDGKIIVILTLVSNKKYIIWVAVCKLVKQETTCNDALYIQKMIVK